jgi:hypothetical protein
MVIAVEGSPTGWDKKGRAFPADNQLSKEEIKERNSECDVVFGYIRSVYLKSCLQLIYSRKHDGFITKNVPGTVPVTSILLFVSPLFISLFPKHNHRTVQCPVSNLKF